MSLIELLNPDFMRELLESFETIANALQNITRVGFDDTSRLRVRAEYLDDGWIRARVDVGSALNIDLIEILREFSWTYYNLAESNKLLSDLTGALSSVGTDILRVSPIDVSSPPDSSPPSKGVMILGYDGAYVRAVKTTSDGKLLAVLG
jgi:hypothetical protein